MIDSTRKSELLCVNTEHAADALSLDANGVPILNEIVDDQFFEDLAVELQTHLLLELEPQLQELIRHAFTDAIRMVALDLKHAFERELNRQLDTRLRALVEEITQRVCHRARL